MEKFTRLTATACPLDVANLNTDQIVPARFLKRPRAAGFGEALLHDLRFDADGPERPDFPLNRPAWRGARIIVGGRNFGCGSSREGAVYALYDFGIRCVIAPSFGDIFAGNSVQNGLLTAVVPDEHAAEIMATLAHAPELAVREPQLPLRHRPGLPPPPARGPGRHRADEELSRPNRGVQGQRPAPPPLGGAGAWTGRRGIVIIRRPAKTVRRADERASSAAPGPMARYGHA
jgi:3-isopropylmalate dehydratase small subunit